MDVLKNTTEGKDKSDTGVQFHEYRVERYYPETTKTVQWVIKYSGGLLKDEKQASLVLIGFALVTTIIALFLIFSIGNGEIRSPKSDIINRPQPQEGYIPR